MKRFCCLTVVTLLALTSLLFSADFWMQKDYSTWSDEETMKMLEDSPWAKRVRIREDRDNLKKLSNSGGFGGGFGGFGGGMGAPGGGQGAPAGKRPPAPAAGGPSAPSGDLSAAPAVNTATVGSAAPSGESSGAAPSSGESGGTAAPADGGGAGAPPGGMGGGMGGFGGGMGGGFGGFGGGSRDLLGGLPLVDVRWQSALPIKQAVMRFNYKDDVKTSKEAQESLNRKETAHILGIIGMPGRKQTYNPEDIKKNSEIIVKKRSIKPAQVLVEQQGDKVSLFLFFAKYNPDGTPLITVDDKEVEISIEAWMYDIIKKFSLKDMVYQGNLEF